jgi:hypothetical protein
MFLLCKVFKMHADIDYDVLEIIYIFWMFSPFF